ncbi:hypothetical protein, partial [Mesorhizobium sp. P5_C1]
SGTAALDRIRRLAIEKCALEPNPQANVTGDATAVPAAPLCGGRNGRLFDLISLQAVNAAMMLISIC